MRKKGAAPAPDPATDCQPSGLLAGIGVAERVPEPCLAPPPIDQQVLDEKAAIIRARLDEPGAPELAHPGVDDGIAGLAAGPGAKRLFIFAKGENSGRNGRRARSGHE